MSKIQKSKDGKRTRIIFGPHHYINIVEDGNKVNMEIGCTHHGVQFDASEINSELYKVIDYLRKQYPENRTD